MTEVMDFIRRSFTVLGAIVFAVLVLAVLTPRAERGVATALGQAAPAPVQVANTSATPVPVEDPARKGVTLLSRTPFGWFSDMLSEGTEYKVPAGQRLVIEDISGSFNTPTDAHISHTLVSAVGYHTFVPHLVTQGNFNIYKFSEKTWFYADPQEGISLWIDTTGGYEITGVLAFLHGHLVDCTNACPGATSFLTLPQIESGSPRPAPPTSPPK
jgi:hypothetical protein